MDESGTLLGPGQEGQIVLRGAPLMAGYEQGARSLTYHTRYVQGISYYPIEVGSLRCAYTILWGLY